ncbi:Alpha-D-glucose-1-phosphate phosphatase YihX [Grifola frondosa]|uniref:Alpha-D-glucose-1-phosphate phosphatase YihX n=1 Tax=Grifola frondosa TaxID=5627 RepID=A0A1C7M8N9_GRIFR|nr:Alpha-D-glucose-1-phosphate phosphatase YihX [Grifola frondosa]
MTAGCKYSTLIVDVSDVLVTWPPNLSPPIPLQVLKSCLDSKTWYDYECGLISKEDCLQLLGERFSLDVTSIDDVWHQVRGSLRPNREMVSLVAEIRVQSGSNLRILGAFNVSPLDYDFFRNRASAERSICNAIYTSAQLGTRMPNLSFFQRVLADENIDPHSTIFMGRNVDDVVTPRSFGIHGVLLKDFDKVRRALRSLTVDPVKRGLDYLRIAAGNLVTETNMGITMMENFGQLLIFEALGDRSLVSLDEPPRRWNFFQGKGILTYDHYPDDLDTTCLGLIVMKPSEEFVHSLIDEMLEYLNDDGIPLTYFDHNTHRIDPVVAVNVLHLFYSYGRGSELKGALEWVHSVLVGDKIDAHRWASTKYVRRFQAL